MTEQELMQKIKVLNIYLKNEEKQLPIFKERLKDKLKIEKQDFESCLNMEMTITLGENLRDQLKTVFKILEQELK